MRKPSIQVEKVSKPSGSLVRVGKRVVIACLAVMAAVVANGIRQDYQDKKDQTFKDLEDDLNKDDDPEE